VTILYVFVLVVAYVVLVCNNGFEKFDAVIDPERRLHMSNIRAEQFIRVVM
jgi:hypothetical protein